MSSEKKVATLARPNKQSRCFVERSDILDNLLADVGSPSASMVSDSGSKSLSSSRSRHGAKVSVSNVSGSPGKVASSSVSSSSGVTNAEVQAKMLLERTRIQRTVENDKKFADLQVSMADSLNFLDNVDKDLSLVDETRRTKTRRQFEDWNQNVHGKIQQKLLHKVNAISAKELHERHLNSYDKFLSITNRKPAIFRDIIIESEYDPLEANRASIKAKFKNIKDPLKIDKQKAQSELSMIGVRYDDGPANSDRLVPQLWAKGKIESTPYGMFAAMMTTEDDSEGAIEGVGFERPESKQRTEREKKMRTSSVVFDDYNYPIGKLAVDKEMPRPKPRMRTIYSDPKALVTDPKTGGPYPMEFQKELARMGKTEKKSRES